MRKTVILALVLIAAAGGAAAQDKVRAALAGAEGGLWEVTEPGTQKPSQRHCVPDPTELAQYYHMGKQCTRVVVDQSKASALIHYTCTGAGYGRSNMQLVTPRSMRIETQGMAGGAPFYHVLHARRVGSCR